MNQITLKGNYKEMGESHGLVLKKLGVNLPPAEMFDQAGLLEPCIKIAEREAPELMQEARALAKCAGLEERSVLALLLTAPLAQTLPTCSLVAVTPERSASGRMLIGRNYDFTYAESRHTATTYVTQPDSAFAHAGNADVIIGREDGLNTSGLFVGMSASFLPGAQPGLAFWLIVRMLLERCATVGEALELLQSLTHAQSRNYLLADQTGEAVVVEATIDGCYVRYPQHGVLAITNHALSAPLRGNEMFIPETSPSRLARLESLAEIDGKIGLEDIQTALNDRESGLKAHAEIFGQPFGTIWSLMAELDGTNQIQVADVQPGEDIVYDMIQF
jgi:hypothetical protein